MWWKPEGKFKFSEVSGGLRWWSSIKNPSAQPSELEKIIANEATDKELISKIYKQLREFNCRKINDQLKNGLKN